MSKEVFAKDKKCCMCDKQAVAFFPADIDPDIPSYPYCADHLEEAMIEAIELNMEITKKAARKYEETRDDTDCRSDNEVVRRAFIAGAKWLWNEAHKPILKIPGYLTCENTSKKQ